MGKGSSAPAPPPVDTTADDMAMQNMMNAMTQMMGQSLTAISSAQQGMMQTMASNTPLPTIIEEQEIDWTDRANQLRNKASADYQKDLRQKHGRSDTVLTSPLLDFESAEVTSSLLTGE